MAGGTVSAGGSWMTTLSPELAARKRRCETDALAALSRWGYDEIITPLVEPYDVLARGAGEGVLASTFRFVGPEGDLLALRADITTPVARMVSRSELVKMPLRVCYVGPVYRRTRDGAVEELYQAGAELVGAPGAGGDAETIALLGDVISHLGVVDFRIGVGHVGLVDGLSRDLGCDDAARQQIREAIAGGNLVALERQLAGVREGAAKELLLHPFGLSEPFEILERLAGEVTDPEAATAVSELSEVFSAVGSRAQRVPVALDPGVVRDFDYYSGPVFAVYVPGLGRAAGGGGRYDGLLRRYGRDLPATGFALSLSDLLRLNELGMTTRQPLAGIH